MIYDDFTVFWDIMTKYTFTKNELSPLIALLICIYCQLCFNAWFTKVIM